MAVFNKIRLSYLDELEKDFIPTPEVEMFNNNQSVEGARFMEPLFGQEVAVFYWTDDSSTAKPNGEDRGILINPKDISRDIKVDPNKWTHFNEKIKSPPNDDMIILRRDDTFDTRWIMDIKGSCSYEVTMIDIERKMIVQGTKIQIEAWLKNV